MPTLTYPSAMFPGRPALRLELPDGWEAVPAVGDLAGAALVAMRPTAGIGAAVKDPIGTIGGFFP
jgi:hypothetical protein